MTPDEWSQGRSSFRDRSESVERPRSHEGLRVRDIREEYRLDAAALSWSPAEQRQCPNDLQPDLPSAALRQWTDEDSLVRLDQGRVIVGELFH